MAKCKHEEHSKFTISRRTNKDDEESKLTITRRSDHASNKVDELERCPLCLLLVAFADYHDHVQGCLENMYPDEHPQEDQKMMDDEDQIDFNALNDALMSEPIGTNTNTLDWDAIVFMSDEEREGSKQLQNELHKKHNIALSKLPPFEMARFYIGSKCRIPKAVDKWMALKAFYDKHNLQSVTEQQMMKCFQEMSRSIRFGGTDSEGRSIIVMQRGLFYPSNFEAINVLMRCFFAVFSKLSENLYCARNGLIVIEDCANMGLINCDFNVYRASLQLTQDTYPMRIGAIYLLNAPKLIEIVIQIMKPFMSQKLQERIIMTTAKELFTMVAQDQVPDSIEGGTYDDRKLDPMYQGCVRYMRRSNMDCFAS